MKRIEWPSIGAADSAEGLTAVDFGPLNRPRMTLATVRGGMVNRTCGGNHAALPAEVTQRFPLKLSCPQAPPAGGVVKTVERAVWKAQLIYPRRFTACIVYRNTIHARI
jgi:hypothetical protein